MCVADMYDFTIAAEDRPGFKCEGLIMGNGFHMQGFKNEPLSLATFPSIASNGDATMIITRRSDGSVHFLTK